MAERPKSSLLLALGLILCLVANGSGNPTAALVPCTPDVNGDGVVDLVDLVSVSVAYNPYGAASDLRADVNDDGVVDLYDLVSVASCYGSTWPAAQPPLRTPTVTRTHTPLQTPTRTPLLACPPVMPDGLTRANLVHVVDGDTIDVAVGGQIRRVRYIGVNAAEPDQPFGPDASAKNAELLGTGTIYLEGDIQDQESGVPWDPRLLRYVWSAGWMVNAELVRFGYAQVATYPPNVKYQDCFLQLQNQARTNKSGLWGPRRLPTPAESFIRVTAVPAPSHGNIEATAYVSDPSPRQNSTVTVYGQITRDGVGILGVPMYTTWHYKTTTSYCSGISGLDGVASCSRMISRATKGYFVSIVVEFTFEGRSHRASTGFSPH